MVNELPNSYVDALFYETQNMQETLNSHIDNQIKQVLIENGFNVANENFLRDNFQFLEIEGDSFRHLYFHYGMPDEKRILSLSKVPELTMKYNEHDNTCLIKAELKIR